MFQSAVRFLAALVFTFVLLTYMWVNAAQAAECRTLPSGVVACEGSALPDAPRGTVRRLPRVPTYRTAMVRGYTDLGARVGVTVVIARLGR